MKTEPKMDAVCATEYSMSGSIRDGLGDGRRFWHLLGQCEMSDVQQKEQKVREQITTPVKRIKASKNSYLNGIRLGNMTCNWQKHK